VKARYVAIPTVGKLSRILPASGVLMLLIAWWAITHFGVVKTAFLPTPVETAKAFTAIFSDGRGEPPKAGEPKAEVSGWQKFSGSSFVRDGWASVRRVLLAILLSTFIGIPIGLLMGAFGRVESVLKWIVFPLRTAPMTAFIPIFMLFFGIEEEMKVWFLFFGTVVYIVPLTFDAIRAVPSEYVDSAVDYGFSPMGTLWHFLIPAAWPRIFDAIKVCTGIAWTYLVAAEIVNVTTGLGAVVAHAQRFQNTPKVFAGILLILVIGNTTDFILGTIRDRFFSWEA
jgi:ABC-type nitrate/sulfonate/bicarbonate transport system permease component